VAMIYPMYSQVSAAKSMVRRSHAFFKQGAVHWEGLDVHIYGEVCSITTAQPESEVFALRLLAQRQSNTARLEFVQNQSRTG
jgi:hypothetical protein